MQSGGKGGYFHWEWGRNSAQLGMADKALNMYHHGVMALEQFYQ